LSIIAKSQDLVIDMDQIRPWLCIRQVVVRVVSPQDIAEASGPEVCFPSQRPMPPPPWGGGGATNR
jgi:hypothetical protein